MKKKVVVMTIAAAMAVTSLVGCGSASSSAAASNAAASADTEGSTAASDTTADTTADTTDTSADAAESAGGAMTGEISVQTREDGSGTRGAFIELMGIEVKNDAGEKEDMTTADAGVTNSTEVMLSTVAGNPQAIGYVSLGSLNDTVKAVTVDGVEATAENVANGTYTVARPFNIATLDSVSDSAKDFISYILSKEGQTIIEDEGYIAVDQNAAAYAGTGATEKVVVGGSSSVSPVMEKLKEAYVAVNPDADIEIQTSDSTTGMTDAAAGTCDIGMASRDLKDEELAAGLTNTVIANDGIAVIVNKENPINNLTKDQIMNIYTGNVTAWDDITEE